MFDIVGILILIVVIAIFAFLTTRAWKLKNAFLRWAGIFLLGLLTLIPAALLVLALVGFSMLNKHYDNPVASIQVERTQAQIARGEQLAHTCSSCHSPGNELPLSGSNFGLKFEMPPLGTLYAPNLTPSGDIQDWSDGELIRAIREGLHKNGRSLLVMPSGNYRNLSDEDAQAIVAYLRSQPATGGPTPKNHFNMLGAVFMNLSDFRTAQQPVGRVTAPETGTAEYGKYLVDVTGCRDCHGDQLQGKVDNGQPGPTSGPNLTKIVLGWTEEQFMAFFNTGKLPGGGQVPMITLASGFTEPRMPWSSVRATTTDAELKDMFAYLHNLWPMESQTR
jgi:mono/diheme cytochrome c family protein